MTLYVDSSAFVSRFASDEDGHDEAVAIMERHDDWVTSRITLVEAPRALHLMTGRANASDAVQELFEDMSETILVDVDNGILALARDVAIETRIKTLDAIHLASVMQFPTDGIELLTFDSKQARAARDLGLRLARTES